MSDIEWLSQSGRAVSGDVVEPDISGARGLAVGPDEILVVVFPQFVGMAQLEEHRARFREAMGDRFVIVSGGDVMLAKVKSEDWATHAIQEQRAGR